MLNGRPQAEQTMTGGKSAKADMQPEDAAKRLSLSRFLPYQLSVAAESVSRVFARRYEESFGLTVPEWRVMAVLAETDRIPTQDIIERTQMDPVRVSRAAIRLADKGLVQRKTNPRDQRAHLLSLSAEGLAVYGQIVPLARDLEQDLTETLTEAERAQLEAILAKIHARGRMLLAD
ncbi:MAG: MarR family transcriptional regulator [Hyphomicrobiales bacterium]|nr:MarR family transcriptional regulator [Hyphomicrobiales bacterium]